METKNNNEQNDKNPQAYFKMGYLLKRKREPADAVEVNTIINSDLPLDEQIKRIEIIDNAAEKNLKIDNSTEKKQRYQELLRKNRIVTSERASYNAKSIKFHAAENSFFGFLFQDSRLIKKFSKQHPFIKVRRFPPRIDFTSNIAKHFSIVKKDIQSILQSVYFVLELGWLHLDKLDFNLIANFKKLCESIMDLHFISFSRKALHKKFAQIETNFLICHYHSEYPEIILEGIRDIMEKYNKPFKKIQKVLEIAGKVLSKSSQTFSIYYLILAMQMVDYRRYIPFKNLFQHDGIDIINTFSFECELNTQMRITKYIQENSSKLGILLKQIKRIKQDMEFFKEFIPSFQDEKNDDSFTKLALFYEYEDEEDRCYFANDRNEALFFADNFFRKFFKELENFFIFELEFAEIGMIRMFNTDFFNIDLSKLKVLTQKLSKNLFTCPRLLRERLRFLKDSSSAANASPSEVAIVQIIEELSGIILKIGEKLGHIVVNYQHYEKNKDEIMLKPIEPFSAADKRTHIAFWNNKIISDGFLKGRVFSEAVHLITSICFQAGAFLYDKRFNLLTKDRLKIISEIDCIKENLQRIADIVTFEGIKNTYSF